MSLYCVWLKKADGGKRISGGSGLSYILSRPPGQKGFTVSDVSRAGGPKPRDRRERRRCMAGEVRTSSGCTARCSLRRCRSSPTEGRAIGASASTSGVAASARGAEAVGRACINRGEEGSGSKLGAALTGTVLVAGAEGDEVPGTMTLPVVWS